MTSQSWRAAEAASGFATRLSDWIAALNGPHATAGLRRSRNASRSSISTARRKPAGTSRRRTSVSPEATFAHDGDRDTAYVRGDREVSVTSRHRLAGHAPALLQPRDWLRRTSLPVLRGSGRPLVQPCRQPSSPRRYNPPQAPQRDRRDMEPIPLWRSRKATATGNSTDSTSQLNARALRRLSDATSAVALAHLMKTARAISSGPTLASAISSASADQIPERPDVRSKPPPVGPAKAAVATHTPWSATTRRARSP